MSPAELLRSVTAGKFKPAYYLYGSEDYRIVEARKFLVTHFLPDKQLLTNYVQLSGKSTPFNEILAALAAYPMLGEKQVVSIDDIQRYKPTELDQILKQIDPPDPHRLVLFSTPSARIPRKDSRFIKTIAKAAETIRFSKLTSAETASTITRRLSALGMSIDPEALDILAGLIAGNRGGLESEVNKLIDYLHCEKRITVADVRAVASGYEAYEVYDIAEKVVAGDAPGALGQARQLLTKGQSATGVIFFLGQHYLCLYLVKSGKPLEPQLQWLARKARPQAGKYSIAQLEEALVDIAEADSAIRRQEFTPEIAIERLIVQLVNSGNYSGARFRSEAGRKNV